MKKYNLIESDFELSEDKLKIIEQEENVGSIRNIAILGNSCSDTRELYNKILSMEKKAREI